MSKKDEGQLLEQRQRFETGSERQSLDDVRYDLISPIGLKRLAQTYAEGARKYTDRNWEKGQPFGVLLNHAIDHINDFIAQQLGLGEDLGISDEDHLAHAVWNLFAIMHFQATKPEMNDLIPHHETTVSASQVGTSKLTAMEHPDKHAFQGSDVMFLCEACMLSRNHPVHYSDEEEANREGPE